MTTDYASQLRQIRRGTSSGRYAARTAVYPSWLTDGTAALQVAPVFVDLRSRASGNPPKPPKQRKQFRVGQWVQVRGGTQPVYGLVVRTELNPFTRRIEYTVHCGAAGKHHFSGDDLRELAQHRLAQGRERKRDVMLAVLKYELFAACADPHLNTWLAGRVADGETPVGTLASILTLSSAYGAFLARADVKAVGIDAILAAARQTFQKGVIRC
jgi:hypothetical protein